MNRYLVAIIAFAFGVFASVDAEAVEAMREEVQSFQALVAPLTPGELVASFQHEAQEPSHGDDAAPGLGDEDLTSRDELELEEAETF